MVESDDWWIIPGENLVAELVGKASALICGVAATASDAKIVLQARLALRRLRRLTQGNLPRARLFPLRLSLVGFMPARLIPPFRS